MIRDRLTGVLSVEPGFEYRRHEPTRLENFSDGVFAFALTLLVVSLEVPASYAQLMSAMQGFVSFGLCFALLSTIWALHVRFFRRYALEDAWISLLNFTLLFFILFFVYPLKFLFSQVWFGGVTLDAGEFRNVAAIYGAAFAAVFATFTLMYFRAWRLREALDLAPLACLRTRHSIIDNLAMTLIGLAYIGLTRALPDPWLAQAGILFGIIPVYFVLSRRWLRRLQRRVAGS